MVHRTHEPAQSSEIGPKVSTLEILGVPDEVATDGERWIAEEIVAFRALGDSIYVEPPGGFQPYDEARAREVWAAHDAVIVMLKEQSSTHVGSPSDSGAARERR